MTDAELRRFERDLENLIIRMRTVEDLATPGLAQHMIDFRELVKRVSEMETNGVAVTRERFRNMEDRIADLRADFAEMKEDQKVTRNIVKSSLITAGLAIGVNIIVGVVLFVVLRGGG